MQVFSNLSFEPSRMTDTFHEVSKSTLNCHAAIRKRKARTEQTPWLHSSIKALMHEHDRTNS